MEHAASLPVQVSMVVTQHGDRYHAAMQAIAITPSGHAGGLLNLTTK